MNPVDFAFLYRPGGSAALAKVQVPAAQDTPRTRGFTALVRSGVQYNNKTMSFADLVLKNIQRFKAKLALNRWIFFLVGSAKLEQLWAAPPL
jgi:hypothetical protein